MNDLSQIPPLVGVVGLLVSFVIYAVVRSYDPGTDALKKIAAKAKLNGETTITKTKGGKEITETKKKHELISNHTSRRSFCTNAYFSGMPTLDIMAISGHTSEKVFLNYIKITDDERALKISENSFFKEKKQ